MKTIKIYFTAASLELASLLAGLPKMAIAVVILGAIFGWRSVPAIDGEIKL